MTQAHANIVTQLAFKGYAVYNIYMILLILGREKTLSKAEVESRFGNYELASEESVIVADNPKLNLPQLGGIIKAGTILEYTGGDMAGSIAEYILQASTEGKVVFGLSYYGFTRADMNLGIKIKKLLKQKGRSCRYIAPKQGMALNAASIIYNKLNSKGFEIMVVKTQTGKILLARTNHIQDINDYSKRDYDKPCRDSKVGMLPPKLSQIMINLADPKQSDIILDPFCGSGGLLMEASLMGYNCEGSDASKKMTDCSRKNIAWFEKEYQPSHIPTISQTSDATTRTYPTDSYCVVSEGYLGTNFTHQPSLSEIKAQSSELEKLYVDLMVNLKNQTARPRSVVICVPFWIHDNQLVDLDILDEITDLGYTIHEFKSVKTSDLRYRREGQNTGRRILVFN